MKNSYLYLEDDFGLSHNIQGLSTLHHLADEHESRISSLSHRHSGKFTADKLANLWGIGIKSVERTLKATTQLSTRHLN